MSNLTDKIYFDNKYQAAFGTRDKAKGFHFKLSLLSSGGFWQKIVKVVKIFRPKFQMTQTSNYFFF